MDYAARIKVHDPVPAGVLVEAGGELDISCLEAFGYALDRAAAMATTVFVDLSGVGFMDALCARELLRRAKGGPARFRVCEPSPEVELSAAACGFAGQIETCPADDRGYAAVIREICRCRVSEENARRTTLRAYLREPTGG